MTRRFIPHPDLADTADSYTTITVDPVRVMASYRESLFAFEWLEANGRIKDATAMKGEALAQRQAAEAVLSSPQTNVPMPILGIGVMGNIEIGSGRAIFLLLAAQGVHDIPVHIPVSMMKEFKKFMTPNAASASERGNVLVYILLAIVLIAALSYAVSSTSRHTNTQTVSDGQASTFATEILTYANAAASAAAKLKLRGCTDAQFSFENGTVAGYTNAGAPADESCHVFAPPGGTITWTTPPSGMNDGTAWFYTGAAVVHNDAGVFSTNVAGNADLIMMLFGLPQSVCTKINTRLGITGIPVDDGAYASTTKFTGTYTAAEDINGLPEAGQPSPCTSPSTASNLCGRLAGCFREESGGERYVFFQVLVKR